MKKFDYFHLGFTMAWTLFYGLHAAMLTSTHCTWSWVRPYAPIILWVGFLPQLYFLHLTIKRRNDNKHYSKTEAA